MKKDIIIYLVLGILLFSCKIKKGAQKESIKIESVEEVNSYEKIDLDQITSQIAGNYMITFIESIPEFNEITPLVKIDKTGKISGKNGCNSFFGQLNTEGGGLIQNLGSTRMACEGEADDLERAMMATLKEVTNITIDENFINFYSDDRIVLTGKELSLERGNWQVISIEGKEYEQMPSFEVVNNRMNGHTGCNSFFGMVAQNGFSLKILEPGMTEIDCQDFDMKMESKFMQALGKITEYNKEGEIAIFSHEGKELFRALNPEQE